MGVDWTEKRTAIGAIDTLRRSRIDARKIRESAGTGVRKAIDPAPIATDRVIGGVTNVGVEDSKFSMVENVERFGAKFQIAAFADFKIL